MRATADYSPFHAQQSYGMGLIIGRYQGRPTVYQTGVTSGYHGMIWWPPEEKLGVAILLNRVELAIPHILCLTLADRILKLSATDWNTIYK